MNPRPGGPETGDHDTTSDRELLAGLAACCVGAMVLIILLTSALGVAIGPAVAISLGIVAAGVCVAVMVQRHRRHGS